MKTLHDIHCRSLLLSVLAHPLINDLCCSFVNHAIHVFLRNGRARCFGPDHLAISVEHLHGFVARLIRSHLGSEITPCDFCLRVRLWICLVLYLKGSNLCLRLG
jgi:hypothetical protein